jgi:hypothetical protein
VSRQSAKSFFFREAHLQIHSSPLVVYRLMTRE